MRATSRSRVTSPFGADLDDDVAELFLGLQPALRVDRELQVDPGTLGEAPTMPAAASTFCARISRTMSAGDRPRSATFCGSSQIRIE